MHALLTQTTYVMFPNEELKLTISDQLFFEMLLLEIRGKNISYASFNFLNVTITVNKSSHLLSKLKQKEKKLIL